MKKLTILIITLVLFTVTAGSLAAKERNVDSPVFKMTAGVGISALEYTIEFEDETQEAANAQASNLNLEGKFLLSESFLINARGNLYYADNIELEYEYLFDAKALIFDTDIILGPRVRMSANKISDDRTATFFIPFAGIGMYNQNYSFVHEECDINLISKNSYIAIGVIIESSKIKNGNLSSTFNLRTEALLLGNIMHDIKFTDRNTGDIYNNEREGENGLGFKIAIDKMWYIKSLSLGFGVYYSYIHHDEYEYELTSSYSGTYIMTEKAENYGLLGASIKIGW
ncbi:hypothetical protein KAS08_00340 [Candidatus Pacearchaeota archaeon]|nr:hypothetical protein [Candidatus Pacearchaeota archaeon]